MYIKALNGLESENVKLVGWMCLAPSPPACADAGLRVCAVVQVCDMVFDILGSGKRRV